MVPDKHDLPRLIVPPAAGALLTLFYFAIFNRWEQTGDPLNSIVAPILGAVGFLIGVGVDRWRLRRARAAPPAEQTG
ncbi:MAG TPA: hypothetical protein VKV26_07225 [Dehalococcoidia bacterium]|nr:hypothetical protein [Dehalococcoidia bacterium]